MFHCDNDYIERYILFVGLPCRSSDQICQISRSIQQLSNQTILHQQYPNHLAISPGVQLIRHLSDVGCQVPRKSYSKSIGRLVGCRWWWSSQIVSSRRIMLLLITTGIGRPHRSRSCPCRTLHSLHAWLVRLLLQNVDRGFWKLGKGC